LQLDKRERQRAVALVYPAALRRPVWLQLVFVKITKARSQTKRQLQHTVAHQCQDGARRCDLAHLSVERRQVKPVRGLRSNDEMGAAGGYWQVLGAGAGVVHLAYALRVSKLAGAGIESQDLRKVRHQRS